MDFYRYILALHIISVISWMAGILYLFRLFVYHTEETENVVKERFIIMEERLARIIMLPAMLASLMFGITMLFLNPKLLAENWMRAKVLFACGMMFVTHLSIQFRTDLALGQSKRTSKFFRIMNEVPTLLMMIIVYLVIVRPF